MKRRKIGRKEPDGVRKKGMDGRQRKQTDGPRKVPKGSRFR